MLGRENRSELRAAEATENFGIGYWRKVIYAEESVDNCRDVYFSLWANTNLHIFREKFHEAWWRTVIADSELNKGPRNHIMLRH